MAGPSTKNRGKGHPAYKPEFVKQAKMLCELGATNAELAAAFDVSVFAIKDWQVRHREFGEACRVGKDAADDRVEAALYSRAVGYTFDSEKVFMTKGGDVVRVPTKEHVPPDVKAAHLWLLSRRREDWAIREGDVPNEDGTVPLSNEERAKAMLRLMAQAGAGREAGAKLDS